MTIEYSPPLVPPQGGKQKFTSSLEGGTEEGDDQHAVTATNGVLF